ncbi:hypothetical protein ACS8E6_09790 [Salinicola halophyticus]|uniref:hypothetical protein n=1 Tax=Salinicola halophyticus TaxID=1808881 RepID=UPI0013009117|nr:hypothetical protein [Salinicola halophyticus]
MSAASADSLDTVLAIGPSWRARQAGRLKSRQGGKEAAALTLSAALEGARL